MTNNLTSKPDEMTAADADINEKNYWPDRLHEDFKSMPLPPVFNVDSWMMTALFKSLMYLMPCPSTPPDIIKEKIPGVGVYFYPKNCSHKDHHAALVWIHSGGRIVGSADNRDETKFCHNLCRELDMPILSASYRLAPKHPFPAALDDLTKSYNWLVSRLQPEISDNRRQQQLRIAIAGHSAGGGLAAELCQKLLDENQSTANATIPLPVAQLLIYPMLDDRTCVDKRHDEVPPHLIWNNISNTYGWSSYMGLNHWPGDETLPDYMSASRRQDLANLPPAYIVCGTLDLFLNECKDYAQRLKDKGVDVEYVEIVGGFHGMINFADDKDSVVKLWQSFVAFGKKHLVSA